MPTIEICLSPALWPQFNPQGKVCVIIDVLRATSTIATALANGAEAVIPVSGIDDCKAFEGLPHHILAAERDGRTCPGMVHGNSPLEYSAGTVAGKTLVLTTTNGTQALVLAQQAEERYIASFLNLTATTAHLTELGKDTILICAGWKGRVNLEDTLLAGAMVQRLIPHFSIADDAALLALGAFNNYEKTLHNKVLQSAHAQRLAHIGIRDDIAFCLRTDHYPIVCKMEGNRIVRLTTQ